MREERTTREVRGWRRYRLGINYRFLLLSRRWGPHRSQGPRNSRGYVRRIRMDTESNHIPLIIAAFVGVSGQPGYRTLPIPTKYRSWTRARRRRLKHFQILSHLYRILAVNCARAIFSEPCWKIPTSCSGIGLRLTGVWQSGSITCTRRTSEAFYLMHQWCSGNMQSSHEL
jgi:hypothetical protein